MGVYLYTLGSTGRTKAVVNGETKTLFPMAYRWKFYNCSFGGGARTQDRVIASLESKARKAFAHPEFSGLAFVGEKPVEGEPVYKLFPGLISWVDTGDFPGTVVGRLKKVGRSWQVVPAEEMPNFNELNKFWKDNGYSKAEAYSYYNIDVAYNLPCHMVINIKDGEFVSGYSHPSGVLDKSKVYSLHQVTCDDLAKLCLSKVSDPLKGDVSIYLSPYNGVCVRGSKNYSSLTAAN